MNNENTGPGLDDFSLWSSSISYGLLILNDYDVFIQEGVIHYNGEVRKHFWVEVYFEGDAFVLDAAARAGDIIFMPKDEAGDLYGYEQGKDYDWNRDDCGERVWQETLNTLGIKQPAGMVLMEIAELIE